MKKQESQQQVQEEERSPTAIFQDIFDEDDKSKSLPARKGFLKLQSLDRDPLNNKAEDKFCVLRNKTLKFYADGPRMMELEGVIDFDVVKCVILIEEQNYDSEEYDAFAVPDEGHP